ncbi:hypothetical protein M5689_011295 [Euphorbia peplus]|nr:hypothetical protein M5689_011295 [Euphorbia peplus]
METGFQRSTTSFRRQGSSGLVWDDDKVIKGDSLQNKENKDDNFKMQRSRSAGAGHGYRTVKVPSPQVDPPSPKVSGCGLCGIFGKPVSPTSHQRKSRKSSKR